jgi:hypothetical protein
MHIAHLVEKQFLTVQELAKRMGLKRRQIAAEARKKRIPGVIRPDGYHYAYPLTPELLDWVEQKRRQVQRRKKAPAPERRKMNTGVITLQGIRAQFDVWLRRVGGLNGILKMGPEHINDILFEIEAIAKLHWQIIEALKGRAEKHSPKKVG